MYALLYILLKNYLVGLVNTFKVIKCMGISWKDQFGSSIIISAKEYPKLFSLCHSSLTS